MSSYLTCLELSNVFFVVIVFHFMFAQRLTSRAPVVLPGHALLTVVTLRLFQSTSDLLGVYSLRSRFILYSKFHSCFLVHVYSWLHFLLSLFIWYIIMLLLQFDELITSSPQMTINISLLSLIK